MLSYTCTCKRSGEDSHYIIHIHVTVPVDNIIIGYVMFLFRGEHERTEFRTQRTKQFHSGPQGGGAFQSFPHSNQQLGPPHAFFLPRPRPLPVLRGAEENCQGPTWKDDYHQLLCHQDSRGTLLVCVHALINIKLVLFNIHTCMDICIYTWSS